MGRRKKNESPAGGAARPPTGVVRVYDDLARKISIMSTARRMDVADFLDPIIRAAVEREYERWLEQERKT